MLSFHLALSQRNYLSELNVWHNPERAVSAHPIVLQHNLERDGGEAAFLDQTKFIATHAIIIIDTGVRGNADICCVRQIYASLDHIEPS